MKNINLNAGGVIGSLACGGIAAVVVFSNVDPADTGRGPYRLIILALIGGAFAGNFLWGLVFKRGGSTSESNRPRETEPPDP